MSHGTLSTERVFAELREHDMDEATERRESRKAIRAAEKRAAAKGRKAARALHAKELAALDG